MVRNLIIPPSMAYLVLPQIKDMTTIAVADVGEHFITLASDTVPVGRAKELVTCGRQRHVVGVVSDISHSHWGQECIYPGFTW